MKTLTPRNRNKVAFSLFITLVCVILITLFMVSLLSSVSTESTSTRLYTTSMSLNRMADSAVNIVQAQITAATSQSSSGINNDAISWASQPGMIRTYESDGSLHKVFKLYTWDNMVIDEGDQFDPTSVEELPSRNWESETAVFTDLNEPVNGVYPIVDPAAFEGGVEGFELDSSRVEFSIEPNTAPMPVKWLYVLRDGTMVAPDTQGDGVTALISAATEENPIVGRVAFWTDDETAKVNINTASEGSFWDMPRAANAMEAWQGEIKNPEMYGLSSSVPVYNEYQRVPGHPATTSLASVLGDSRTLPAQRWIERSLDYETHKPYYNLTPRIAGGGSQGGLQYVTQSDPDDPSIPLDGDRLFASVGELLFDPERNRSGAGYQALSPDLVRERSFFLTNFSRAPEENLFNKPRVSLWPLQNESQPGVRNAKDKLLAFVSELGTEGNEPLRYHFLRNRAYTFNNTTSLAGEFGPAHSMREDLVSPGVARNQELLNYLYSLSTSNVPGFGASFATKYPQDIEQILIQSFDYVRSSVNTVNSSLEPKYNYVAFDEEEGESDVGRGFVMPIRGSINNVERQGFGRASVIREFTFVLFAGGYDSSPSGGGWVDNKRLGEYPVKKNELDFDGDGSPDELRSRIWVGSDTFVQDFDDARQDFIDNSPSPPTAEQIAKHMVGWLETNALIDQPDGVPDDVPERFLIDFTDASAPTDPEDEEREKFLVPHYDGVGDAQTTHIGFYFLINPAVLNAGHPEVYNSVRYQIDGLDRIPINIPNIANGNIKGPSEDEAVLVLRGEHHASQGEMGFYDIVMAKDSTWNARGRILDYNDGKTSEVYREDPKSKRFPWFSKLEDMFEIPGGAPPSEWKLNERGNYVRRKNSSDGLVDRPKMTFGPVDLTVKVYPSLTNDWDPDTDLIQQYEIRFPQQQVPIPQILRPRPTESRNGNENDRMRGDGAGPLAFAEVGKTTPEEPFIPRAKAFRMVDTKDYHEQARFQPDFYFGFLQNTGNQMHSGYDLDPRKIKSRWNRSMDDGPPIRRPDIVGSLSKGWSGQVVANEWGLIRPGDVTRSLVVSADSAEGSPRGDWRLILARKIIPEEIEPGVPLYEPYPGYDNEDQFLAHSLNYRSTGNIGGFDTIGYYQPDTANVGLPSTEWADADGYENRGQLVERTKLSNQEITYKKASRAAVPANVKGAYLFTGNAEAKHVGDFDTGQGNMRDGPWLNKADEAYGLVGGWSNVYFPHNYTPIYGKRDVDVATTYSPNRQIASPVMLGSLPTGVWSMKPWQTLLFNPVPAGGDAHPGHGAKTGFIGPGMQPPFDIVPDHLFLDWFFMPVSEPYPISERFSTAGKVNMNYAMMPFPHIVRSTGLHAVFRHAKINAIPNAAVETKNDTLLHKENSTQFSGRNSEDGAYRFDIDTEKTLTGFENRFYGDNPDIFRSASEITRIYMVPREPEAGEGFAWKTVGDVYPGVPSTPSNYDDTPGWWDKYLVTGDNARESVYNQIYPRVTTKSNTYRVHYRVQTLKKRRASNQDEWVEGADQVLGEMRGSALIERYLDPNARNIPDYAVENDPIPLHSFYRWRVISEQQFRP